MLSSELALEWGDGGMAREEDGPGWLREGIEWETATEECEI